MGRSFEEMIEGVGLLVFISILMLLMLSNHDQPSVNLVALENEPVADEETSTQAVADITSARSSLELLDLPTEIRLMIYRHLLVPPQGLDIYCLTSQPWPRLDILRTSRLIHREASGVFYGETQFIRFPGRLYTCLAPLANAIQNIHVRVDLGSAYYDLEFKLMMQRMGNPLVTHNTLTVDFSMGKTGSEWFIEMKGYVQYLRHFTNFRTIEVHVFDRFETSGINRNQDISDARRYVKLHLEPVLGDAKDISIEGHGRLRFHPLDHRDRFIQDSDWADFLDGVRLEWDEDSTPADDSETPG